jgi:hypothetical protein
MARFWRSSATARWSVALAMTAELLIPGDLSWIKKRGCCFSTAAVIGYWRSVQTGPSFATRADATDGHLVRIFSPAKSAEFLKPRGLQFGPDGHLYCVALDEVVAFDFTTGACLGTTVQFQRLNGQALAFFP